MDSSVKEAPGKHRKCMDMYTIFLEGELDDALVVVLGA